MAAQATVKLSINGRGADVATDPQRSLLEVLRDGKRVFSCSTPVSEVAGKAITTIEGLAAGDAVHPVQQAFVDAGAFQCGYCTSGMILATVALLGATPNPSDEQICDGMNGNLCRCCGYGTIKDAVKRAAAEMSKR
jgi:carbon-monoxide dehydrogenase small subunit